jgi:chromosome segregation ATPase
MAGLVKNAVRFTVIGALVGGTAIILFPDRSMALVQQARHRVTGAIDSRIEDPIRLRAQLRDLEAQFPRKIAGVRTDLAELQAERAQFQRQLDVSAKVAELARADLAQLQDLIDRGEQIRAEDPTQTIRITFSGQRMDLSQAYGRANSISRLIEAYERQEDELAWNLELLGEQESQLAGLLGQLQAEHAEFQAQLWQLDRQVDAIARNDRMIEVIEHRQAKLNSYEVTYRGRSLDHVTTNINRKLTEQHQRLAELNTRNQAGELEDRARYELEAMVRANRSLSDTARGRGIEIAPPVVEIGPDPRDAQNEVDRDGKVATRR